MQAHGGRLELTTLPKGTCFRVYLPVEAEVLDAARTPGSRGPHHPDSHHPDGHHPDSHHPDSHHPDSQHPDSHHPESTERVRE